MSEQPNKSNPVKDFGARLGILGELMVYLWAAKMWWMIPMLVILILFALLMAAGSTGSAGSFVYTLF